MASKANEVVAGKVAYRREDYYNKEQLKRECGFTDGMINKLLPGPAMTRPNPHYRNAAPVKLWRKDDVNAIMRSESYAVECAKASKRRAAALQGAKTREAKTLNQVKAAIESICVYRPEDLSDYDAILAAGVEHAEARAIWRGEYGCHYADADEGTKRRLAVNFIRHVLTDYDAGLYQLKGKAGREKAYVRYRNGVLEAIAKVYPELKGECVWQKR